MARHPAAVPQGPVLTLALLGPPTATVSDGATPPELLWRKHLALLAYLVRSPQQRRTRDHLIGLLWGDKPEAAARHSLREALRVLRKALGASLQTESDQIALDPAACRLDLDDLDTHAANGEFMEGFAVPDAPPFDDWLEHERAYWRGRCADILRARVTVQLGAGLLSAARDSALAAHRLAPGREDLIRLADRLQAASARPFGRPAAPPPSVPVPRPPLIGRAQQVSALLEAWSAIAAGRAGCLIIQSAPGMGRSRLLEESVSQLLQSDVAVGVTRLVPADQTEPGAAMLAMTRPLHRLTGVGAAPSPALATLAARFPDWADRFPAAMGHEPAPVITACRDVILAAAEEQPLLLAIDDAQWLDPSSATALEQLLRDAHNQPLGFLLALALPEGGSLADTFTRQMPRTIPGVRVALDPWTAPDVTALVAWATPESPMTQQERLTRRLLADSAGVPLLAVELLRAVRHGLDLGAVAQWPAPSRTLDQTLPGDMPQAVVAAVRIAFRQLSPAARDVAGAGAVIADRLTPERLARATALPLAGVWDAIDELERHGWWVADHTGFAFAAGLVRSIVAQDLVTAGQRRRYTT